MVPILLKFNQQAHDVELAFANQDLALYNNLLNGAQAAVPGLALALADLVALISDPKGFAFDKITNGAVPEMFGVPVSREYAISVVQFPDNWLSVIVQVDAFNQDYQTNTVYKSRMASSGGQENLYTRLSTDNIELDNGVLALTVAFTNALNAKYSIYTKSDNQVNIYNALNGVFTALNQIKALGANIGQLSTLSQIGMLSSQDGKSFVFDPTAIVSNSN